MSDTLPPQPANGPAGASSVSLSIDGRELMRSMLSMVSPSAQVRTRRVAILGFAETVKDAPVHDPSWELWGMNGFWRAAKPDFGIDVPEERFGLWFDMHTVEYTREYGKRAGFGDAQERWLEQPHPFPVLMLDEAQEFPSVKRYPLEDVISAAGRDYFTSTIAYALGYAMTLTDVAEVGLWGIDLVHETEYADQRPCAEYHIRGLEAHGVKVTIHEKSALLRQRGRYGYDSENPLFSEVVGGLEMQIATIEKKLAELRERHEQTIAEMQTNDGALQLAKTLLGRLAMWQRGGRI